MIEIEGVCASYRGRRRTLVLRGVDLAIGGGEVAVIAGATGSGKTTLVNLVLGRLRAGAGAVRVFGHDVGRLRPSSLARMRRAIGAVPQRPELIDEDTVRDNVAVALEVGGFARIDIDLCVEEALAGAELAAVADVPVGELSAGERKRVAIARALIGEPMLVVADDPTADLDARGAAWVLAALTAAKERGAAVMAATCDRAVVAAAAALGWASYDLDGGLLCRAEAGADGGAAADTDTDADVDADADEDDDDRDGVAGRRERAITAEEPPDTLADRLGEAEIAAVLARLSAAAAATDSGEMDFQPEPWPDSQPAPEPDSEPAPEPDSEPGSNVVPFPRVAAGGSE